MTAKTRTAKRSRPPGARALRKRLILKLPDMLDAAIAAYQQIAMTAPADDPKTFAATHSGAKAALVHIEQIIKLAEAAIVEEDKTPKAQKTNVEALLNLARQTVDAEEAAASAPPGSPEGGS